jgi:hypothetical protein
VDTSEALITREGPVLTLTFNRPEARNAMTWAMYQRLTEACEEVDADDSVRVFVLRGAGGKAFVGPPTSASSRSSSPPRTPSRTSVTARPGRPGSSAWPSR